MPPVSRAQAKISRLYSQGLRLVEQEMEAISKLMQYGEKLAPGHAKDLRDYIKLLADMKEVHDRLTEERRAKAKEATKAVPDEALIKAVTGAGGMAPVDTLEGKNVD
jgi:hypothetical protein